MNSQTALSLENMTTWSSAQMSVGPMPSVYEACNKVSQLGLARTRRRLGPLSGWEVFPTTERFFRQRRFIRHRRFFRQRPRVGRAECKSPEEGEAQHEA